MRRKILWIAMWVTMVLWLGQAWAQSDATADPPAGPRTTAVVTEVPAGDIAADNMDPAAAIPAASEPARPDSAPSPAALPGPNFDPAVARALLERTDWPRLEVAAADGRTHHGPTWLTTKTPTAEQMPRLEGRRTMEALEASLAHADAAYYGPTNLAAIGEEAARLVGAVATWPLKVLVTEPVWKTQTTP